MAKKTPSKGSAIVGKGWPLITKSMSDAKRVQAIIEVVSDVCGVSDAKKVYGDDRRAPTEVRWAQRISTVIICTHLDLTVAKIARLLRTDKKTVKERFQSFDWHARKVGGKKERDGREFRAFYALCLKAVATAWNL